MEAKRSSPKETTKTRRLFSPESCGKWKPHDAATSRMVARQTRQCWRIKSVERNGTERNGTKRSQALSQGKGVPKKGAPAIGQQLGNCDSHCESYRASLSKIWLAVAVAITLAQTDGTSPRNVERKPGVSLPRSDILSTQCMYVHVYNIVCLSLSLSLSLSMCVYIYIYIYIIQYIYIYIYIYIDIYIYIYIYRERERDRERERERDTHPCTRACINIHTCTYAYTHVLGFLR